MSFDERVQRKRLERDQQREAEWNKVVAEADAPELVARMASYQAALEALKSDLLHSPDFVGMFGDSPSIMVSRPGESLKMIGDMKSEGLESTGVMQGRVVSMHCGDASTTSSLPPFQMSIRLDPLEGSGVDCRLDVVCYEGQRYDAPYFSQVKSDRFPALSPARMVDRLEDLLAEVVMENSREVQKSAPAEEHGAPRENTDADNSILQAIGRRLGL